MSHDTWGRDKDITPTTWGANWDTCSIADHVVTILDPSPYYIQKVSIITYSNNKGNISREIGKIVQR